MKIQVHVHVPQGPRPRSAVLVCQTRVPGVQHTPCLGYCSVEPVEIADLGGWYFAFVVRSDSELFQASPDGNVLVAVEAADGRFTTWIANLAPYEGVVEVWAPGGGD